MGKPRTGRWGVALGSIAVALTVTSGCNPYGFYSGTDVHDATVEELAGTWKCIEGTQVTLRRDGTAAFQRLDGADFDFDDGWRLTGNGTWKLTDGDDGQEIRLALTDRTGVEYRTDHTRDATSVSAPPPTTYTWDLYVDRDQDRRLWLFFFYSDPDAGNRYVLFRPRA